MKVLIGVCGIGYGHSSRQFEVARWLAARGHEVRFLTFGASSGFFDRTEFADVVSSVYVPWVACGSDGLEVLPSLKANWRSAPKGLMANRKVLRELEVDGFRPDVCVSDYEPVVAWYARRRGVPLVTVDQQSKFLGYQLPPVGQLSRKEERARLGLFFPKAARRIATSFYAVQAPADDKYDVEIVPPIIRDDVLAIQPDEPQQGQQPILVYLSRYGEESFVPLTPLVDKLEKFKDHQFVVYTEQDWDASRLMRNVVVRPPHRQDFTADLAACAAVICTAGHTLMSEAIYLLKPILAIPLATFDQHLCAEVVSEAGIGLHSRDAQLLDLSLLEAFLSGLDGFRGNMGSHLLLRPKGESVIDVIGRKILEVAA